MESALYGNEKKLFVKLMNKTLALMEVSIETKWDILKENCNEINIELCHIHDAYAGTNQMKSEFYSYYFDLPVMYINTLYNYYEAFIYQ